jgi:hypothetical protein
MGYGAFHYDTPRDSEQCRSHTAPDESATLKCCHLAERDTTNRINAYPARHNVVQRRACIDRLFSTSVSTVENIFFRCRQGKRENPEETYNFMKCKFLVIHGDESSVNCHGTFISVSRYIT